MASAVTDAERGGQLLIATIASDEIGTPFWYAWLPFANAGFELVVFGDNRIGIGQASRNIQTGNQNIAILVGNFQTIGAKARGR